MLKRIGLAFVVPVAVVVLAVAAVHLASGPVQSQARFTREPNLDRSGNDLAKELLAADAGVEACEALCAKTSGCLAYTFVKRGTTVPQPICWLKNTVPTGYPSSCCTSGVLQPGGK